MAITLEQFGKALALSRLMSTDEVKAAWTAVSGESRPKSAEEFAARLVADGRLTRFQADELLTGQNATLVMGDYVLLSELGAGGMGKVYKAHHRSMGRIVALKVMSQAAMKDESAVKRFQREVRAAARLEHPNIVVAYDSGSAGNVQYLVMQFVDGGDLASLIRKDGPLPIERAVEYVSQAAQGLAFAHGEGVIHRDIKPANLLLDKRGVVKILDLGLARIEDSSSSDGLTATEQVMGTVDYMAPEQAADTKHVDSRADIYSLGCTLWYLLTGKRMYDGDTMIQRLMKHKDAALPSLVKARDDAPWSLEQTFHKMVAKRPQDRFDSMTDVAAALEPHRPTQGGASSKGGAAGDGGTMMRSAELSAFFKAVGPTPTSKTPSGATQTAEANRSATLEATAKYDRADYDTDPKSEILSPPAPSATVRDASWKLLAGGVAACAVLLVGAIVYFSRGGDGVDSPDVKQPLTNSSTGAGAVTSAKPAPPPLKAPFSAKLARDYQEAWAAYLGVPVETTNSLGMKFVLIPPGEFLMGSTEAEIAEYLKQDEEHVRRNPTAASLAASIRSEGPQHRVTLTKPYYLGATKVTVGQFRRFCEAAKYQSLAERELERGNNKDRKTWKDPGFESSDEHPASRLTQGDALALCQWLSPQERLPPAYMDHSTLGYVLLPDSYGYRLPTEAEWEYTCRAGTTTPFFWGTDSKRVVDFRSGTYAGPGPVMQSGSNPFGAYDLFGSVSEYCQDRLDRNFYASSPSVDPTCTTGADVTRRGSSYSSGSHRSATRGSSPPAVYNYHYGFRIARTVPLPGVTVAAPPPVATAPATVAAPASPLPTVPAGPSFFDAVAKPPPGDYALEFGGGKTTPFAVLGWNYSGDAPLTIEAWIILRSQGYATFWGNGKQAGMRMGTQTDHWEFGFQHQTPEFLSWSANVRSKEPPTSGRRTHIAVVYDPTEMRLYVDGVVQNQFAKKIGKYDVVTEPFMVGGSPNNLGGSKGKLHGTCNAVIDEFRLSRVARYRDNFTPAQRFEPDADAEALYHFDEGFGSEARDASSHARHAKLGDTAWVKSDGTPIPVP